MFSNIFKKEKHQPYIWRYEGIRDYSDIIKNADIKIPKFYDYKDVISGNLNLQCNTEMFEYWSNKLKFLALDKKYIKNKYAVCDIITPYDIHDSDANIFFAVRDYIYNVYDKMLLQYLYQAKIFSYYDKRTISEVTNITPGEKGFFPYDELMYIIKNTFYRLPDDLLPNVQEWINNKPLSDIVYKGKTINQILIENNLTKDLGFVKCLYDLVKDENIPYKCKGQILYLLADDSNISNIIGFDLKKIDNHFFDIPEEFMPDILLMLEGKELPVHDIDGISLKGCIWAYEERNAIQQVKWNNIKHESEYNTYINNLSFYEKQQELSREIITCIIELNDIFAEISKNGIANNTQNRNYYYSHFIYVNFRHRDFHPFTMY